MSSVLILKTLILFVAGGLFVSWLTHKIFKTLLLTLVVLAAAVGAGVTQSRGEITAWVERDFKKLQANAEDDKAFRYLAGDCVPVLRKLGGTIPPAVESLLKERAKSGTTCHKALARRALGEDADVESACR